MAFKRKGGAFKGMFGEYSRFRYGNSSAGSVYDPRIQKRPLQRPQHDEAVKAITSILRNWNLSPFQYEASCRHGLRRALCLSGHGWAPSEAEAAEIVEEALRNLRARRPTWREGQRDVVDTVENCVHCRRPLDDNQMAHGDRFCSADCARTHIMGISGAWQKQTTATALAAQKILAVASRPKRSCTVCGTLFRPRGHSHLEASYCTPKCRGEAARIHHARECQWCQKTFLPSHTQGQRFCSIGCKTAARRAAEPIMSTCLLCGKPFAAHSKSAKYCSKVCRNQVAYYQSKGLPSVITVRSFDYLISMPVNSTRTPWMTPEHFDEMVSA